MRKLFTLFFTVIFLFSGNVPQGYSLAPEARFTMEEFKDRFLAGYTLLSHEAVNNYIKEAMDRVGLDNVEKRKDTVFFDLEGERINLDIEIYAISGLLSNTGQFEHVGLGRKNGKPVIYVDEKFKFSQKTLDHAKDEIASWERQRKALGLDGPEGLRRWISGNERAKQKAKQFHQEAERMDSFAKRVREAFRDRNSDYYVDIESIYNLYLAYGLNEDDSDENIASGIERSGEEEPRGLSSKEIRFIEKEYGDPLATSIVAGMLNGRLYDGRTVNSLISTATDKKASWDMRKLSSMALERQVLLLGKSLPDENRSGLDELTGIFLRLGVLREEENKKMGFTDKGSLQREGYVCESVPGFFNEVISRIKKEHRAVKRVFLSERTTEGLEDLIYRAKLDTRNTLFRYFLDADDIIGRLESLTAPAGRDKNFVQVMGVTPEDARQRYLAVADSLPSLEAEVMKRLIGAGKVYQVSDKTPCAIGSMVRHSYKYSGIEGKGGQETGAIFMKMPGTGIEFEIKGSGAYGKKAAGLRYWDPYASKPVSSRSHVWQGGSGWDLSLREYHMGKFLVEVHRQLFGYLPRMSVPMDVWNVKNINVKGEEVPIFDFFTNEKYWGKKKFKELKKISRKVAETWVDDYEIKWEHKTIIKKLLRQISPSQLFYVGTARYRIGSIAKYLSKNGPKAYFRETGEKYTPEKAKRLVDTILEEILGEYEIPDIEFGNTVSYVKAALVYSRNKDRASKVYLDLQRQMGHHWGMVLGSGSNTNGFGFHERNIGIKREWKNGSWHVDMKFHGLDSYRLPSDTDGIFDPETFLSGVLRDLELFDSKRGPRVASVLGISGELKKKGEREFRKAISESFNLVINGLEEAERDPALMSKSYTSSLKSWVGTVRSFLEWKSGDRNVGRKEWRNNSILELQKSGLSMGTAKSYVKQIEKYEDILEENSYIFEARVLGEQDDRDGFGESEEFFKVKEANFDSLPVFLYALRDDKNILKRMMGAKGVKVQELAESTNFEFNQVCEMTEVLTDLGILTRKHSEFLYRLSEMMVDRDKGPEYSRDLINVICSIRCNVEGVKNSSVFEVMTCRDERREEMRELVKANLLHRIREDVEVPMPEGKVRWHLLEAELLPVAYRDIFATQVNRSSRTSQEAERIWIVPGDRTIEQAMTVIRDFCPEAVFDVALADAERMKEIPVLKGENNIKMMVFDGEAIGFRQIEAIVCALRALHLEKSRVIPSLLHIYRIVNGSEYEGNIPEEALLDAPRHFARRFVFYLPEITEMPVDSLIELNKILVGFMKSA